MDEPIVDAVVVGGGPAGATAATDLARLGRRVVLLDRAGRIKPCGGAIPPRLIRDFAIPDELLVAKIRSARMVSPRDRAVDMPVGEGFVGMVDRGPFDEWLRVRAALAGAERVTGTYLRLTRAGDGPVTLHYRDAQATRRGSAPASSSGPTAPTRRWGARRSRPCPDAAGLRLPRDRARPPLGGGRGDALRRLLPGRALARLLRLDLPARRHAEHRHRQRPKGVLAARRGGAASRRDRARFGETVRREGAPLPLKPLSRFDNGRDVLLTGDAAGLVAPASGEGIYYAMFGGRLAAEAGHAFLTTGNPRALGQARRRFLKAHGRVFWILRLMQGVWYRNDALRERFVSICRDPDVQSLTWDAYMNKELVRAKPAAHARIFFKDLAHLFRWVSP